MFKFDSGVVGLVSVDHSIEVHVSLVNERVDEGVVGVDLFIGGLHLFGELDSEGRSAAAKYLNIVIGFFFIHSMSF